MAWGKQALGKLFISHSSADKPKVRRLEKRLRAGGYDTWLDEKEIAVGDALAGRVSEGVKTAKIVLVVVSKASLESQWLQYELDIATERMIKGHCRVLPVLIDDVEVPAELAGRLYADMRPGKRGGLRRILDTLESEAAKYPKPAPPITMDSADAWTRHQAYEKFLAGLSEQGWFSASMEVSAIRDIDFEGITIDERDVVVDVVSSFGGPEDLTRADFDDWAHRVTEEIQETCGLLVTERQPSRDLRDALGLVDRMGARATSGLFVPSGILVVADLSGGLSEREAQRVLEDAYSVLGDAIRHSSPAPIDPSTLQHD
ncbi:MAG: toll/interleukin-1 receptor domain-containing protein [Actinobacteria bacterium]|nr:toll/interleukin-1 receptor domain-containing protein [Actinomycetota bacterium]